MNYAEKKRMRVMSANTDELIEHTTAFHYQREAVMKAASIARSLLAKTPPGERGREAFIAFREIVREAAKRNEGLKIS